MAKTTAWVFGVIFVIAGVWGLFAQPAIWFIAADVLSSIVHIVVGVVLLVMAGKPAAAVTLKTVGILYVVLAVLGFIQGKFILGSIFATNMTTNWFYLVVGIVVAAIAFAAKDAGSSQTSSAPAAPQM